VRVPQDHGVCVLHVELLGGGGLWLLDLLWQYLCFPAEGCAQVNLSLVVVDVTCPSVERNPGILECDSAGLEIGIGGKHSPSVRVIGGAALLGHVVRAVIFSLGHNLLFELRSMLIIEI